MEEANEETKQRSSVEFQTSTKGVWSFKVKAYNEDIDEAFRNAKKISEAAQAFCDQKNKEG